jgi:hypothetical protein
LADKGSAVLYRLPYSSRDVALVQNVFSRPQARFLRIAPDVPHASVKVLHIPNATFCCQCGRRFFVTRMWSCGSNNFMARRYYTAAPRHFDFGKFISKLGGEFGTASSDQY